MPEKSAYFFKCFSHQSRNELLRLLQENGEMTVEALAESIDISASTVSRHLSLLKMQGIVELRTESPSHYYSVNTGAIIEGFRDFLGFLSIDEPSHLGGREETKAAKAAKA